MVTITMLRKLEIAWSIQHINQNLLHLVLLQTGKKPNQPFSIGQTDDLMKSQDFADFQ
jgi:hypothetical protein